MENGKIKTSTRLVAYLLDLLIVICITSLVISIRFLNPNYDKYLEYAEKYSTIVNEYSKGNITEKELISASKESYYYLAKYSASYNIATIIVVLGYYVLFQKYNNGQTLGKKIMKIKVTNLKGENGSIWQFLLRTLIVYFVYVGGVIPLLLNTILVYILNSSTYLIVTSFINYLFIVISIIALVMVVVSKDGRGLQDLIAKTKVINE